MTAEFTERVRVALEGIPHMFSCGAGDLCDCSRDERIAQRVAEALETAIDEAAWEGNRSDARSAALRALQTGEQP